MAEVGEIVYQVQMDVAQLLTSQRQLDQRLRSMEGGFDRTTRSVNNTETAMLSLSKAATLVASTLSVGAVVHAVDEWGQMAARIKMALNSVEGDVERYSEIQKRFLEVSNRNGKAIETVQALYAGSATSMKELGYNTTQTVDYIESLSSAFTANATGAQQTESAMSSLNRAMVIGTLKGNDWHAVLNSTPSVVSDIAKEISRMRGGIAVTENDVKKMAMEGGISMKIFANAMINARKENNALADSMDNTVADGFTKLTNSAKAYYGELNQAYGVTRTMSAAFADITANFDTFANIANVVALVVGARLVGAFSASVKAKILDVAASAKQSQAYAATARAAEYAATAERRKAAADKESTASAVALAQAEYNVARGSSAEAIALDNLNAKKTIARNASIAYAQSLTAEAAASQAATVAARNASTVMGVLRGGLALIGGPMGFAMLAAAGMMYFSESMTQARKEAADFADSLGEVSAKLKEINYDALNAAIGKTNQQMVVQEEAVVRLRDELDALDKKLLGVKVSTFTVAGEEKKRAEILDQVRVKTGELREATDRLSVMKKFLAQATAEVNARVGESEKIFGSAEDGAGKLANTVQWLAGQIKNAASEQANLNSELSNSNFRSEEGEKYIKQLKEQNELLGITDKRKRAIAAEEQRQIKAGTLAGSKQMEEATKLAGAYYDLSEADKKRTNDGKKAASSAASAAAKEATEAEKLKQKITDLANATKVAELETKGLSREAAILEAVQKLGSKANAAQIAEITELAAKEYDLTQKIKDRKEAFEQNPKAKADQSLKLGSEQLERQMKGNLITEEQYQQRRVTLNAEYAQKIAEQNAKSVVTPVQEMAAQVDPVQALANEHARKLALIKEYENQKVITQMQSLQLMRVANEEYDQQRLDAQWEIWRNQNLGNEVLAASFDAFANNASSALAGVASGAMSATDAVKQLANSVANQLINTFIQMGVEWVKSAIMGAATQNAATVSTTAVQTAGIATTTAASTTAAATTTAAWTPAAIVASIGSFGGAAAIGIGAVVGALAMGVAGRRFQGGPVDAGSMYRVGEGGKPEIFRASDGKQFMIPGDNGRVISNKDMGGGGGGSQVIINIQNYSSASVDARARDTGNGVTIDMIIADISQGGNISQAIERSHQAPRRATE